MRKDITKFAAALAVAGAAILPASAEDSSDLLIETLVEKGILTSQDAAKIQADVARKAAGNAASASKLKLTDSIKELKIYGDTRIRYQYDDLEKQIPDGTGVTQRSRERFRLRLYADYRFNEHFFGGVALETGPQNDSSMQTINPVFSKSNIFISRAFLGYNISDWGTVVAGGQKNPFYHNELYWDADISPWGVTESIAFHKLFGGEEEAVAPASSGLGKDSGYSKNGKSVATTVTTSSGSTWGGFELTLVAGQLAYADNPESAKGSDASNDAWLFVQQLIASYKFNKRTSVTVAPAYLFYNSANIDGSTTFNTQQFGTTTGITASTRDLNIINVPGEVKFPLGPLNGKFYWDFVYNFDGDKRYVDVYKLGYTVTDPTTGAQLDPVSGKPVNYIPHQHGDRDDLAWLAGLEIGQGKGAGAWTFFANYRENGITSLDPNLNDSDFAQSYLNVKGWRIGGTYNFTDFVQIALTAQIADNLDKDLRGGYATNGPNLAAVNSVNVYQVDLNWKF